PLKSTTKRSKKLAWTVDPWDRWGGGSMLEFDDEAQGPGRPVIKVIGVGGGGGNALNTMIEAGVEGVDFIVANTDGQVLEASLAGTKVHLGRNLTKGLGAGANPEIGRAAALEDASRVADALSVIPNDRLVSLAGMKMTLKDAFAMVDNVCLNAVRGISDLVIAPGLINVDFADVRTIMTGMGRALMGTGMGTGDKRAIEA